MDYNELPYLLVSDAQGNIFEVPPFRMIGMSGHRTVMPEPETLIPLPHGSDLFQLPGRIPIGFNPESGEIEAVAEVDGEPVFAVAAFMAPAYLQLLRSAYQTQPGAPPLSLYSYTAVGWKDDQFWVPARRVDPDVRQDLGLFNLRLIETEAHRLLKRYPRNRLVHHLVENCVFRYGCPAARNFTLQRWECPLPTSPGCNAACVGCISEQPQEQHVTAPQERITFIPTPEEIAEIAVTHLENAPRAVVSFGQGCEGEPLLQGDVLEAAIRLIRSRTNKGIINLNTNASRPDVVERLMAAGLDSIRVSLNSAQPEYYHRYYRPRNYTFDDVKATLRVVHRYGGWISLNYFVFPGFTDHPKEMDALSQLIQATPVNMIQTRNLNIDPEWYISLMQLKEWEEPPIGIPAWIRWIQETFPTVKLGYFNPPREEMLASPSVSSG